MPKLKPLWLEVIIGSVYNATQCILQSNVDYPLLADVLDTIDLHYFRLPNTPRQKFFRIFETIGYELRVGIDEVPKRALALSLLTPVFEHLDVCWANND